MTSVVLTKQAQKELRKLPRNVRIRIIEKIEWYSHQENPLHFADTLSGEDEQLYRFRIGTYRIIFEVTDNTIRILKISHRRDVYK